MDKVYRVKPLEWKQQIGTYICYAEVPGFVIRIHGIDKPCYGGTVFDVTIDDYSGKPYVTIAWNNQDLKAAKRRANEWYLSRLMPALEEVK